MSAGHDEVLGKAYDARLMRRLITYLGPHRSAVALAFVTIVIASTVELIQPWLTQQAIDRYIPAGDRAGLAWLAIVFLVLLLIQFGVEYLQTYILQTVGQRIMHTMRMQVYEHFMHLDLKFYDTNPVGRLMTRITTDVDALNDLFTSGVITVFGDLLVLVGIMVAMLVMNWRLALVAFVVLPCIASVAHWFRTNVRESYRQVRGLIARVNAFLQEHLTGIATVQLFNQEARTADRFDAINRDHRDANIASIFYYAVFYPAIELLAALSGALIVWVGGGWTATGAVSVGVLVAFLQYSRRFFQPISDLSEKFNIMQAAMAASERIFGVLDTDIEIRNRVSSSDQGNPVSSTPVASSDHGNPVSSTPVASSDHGNPVSSTPVASSDHGNPVSWTPVSSSDHGNPVSWTPVSSSDHGNPVSWTPVASSDHGNPVSSTPVASSDHGNPASSMAASESGESLSRNRVSVPSRGNLSRNRVSVPSRGNPVSLRFDRVWFAYRGDEYVLRDVSFAIAPGERIGIVGATGSGKTTMISLLLRFYDVSRGRILVNGRDVREWPLAELRGIFGLVLQDVHLFSGTIADNIRLGNPEIGDRAIREAARLVHADEFIQARRGGYDAEVTERGATLSVGQKQLLSFARAVAFDPRVLLLDEATSSIDTNTEALIEEALEVMMTGRTVVAIAHRLSTIQDVDRILVLHKGELRETGTHQELLARRGLYFKLYELQYRPSVRAVGGQSAV